MTWMTSRTACFLAVVLVAAAGAVACDTADGAPSATTLAVRAQDFRFNVAPTTQGGLLQLAFSNDGNEPHFAGLAKIAPGKSFDDVKTALLTPPSPARAPGPPPFEDFGGVPTTDPGAAGKLALNLPAGTYALYCLIPSDDGIPHAAKGMITRLTLTESTARPLPQPAATVTGRDFTFDQDSALPVGPAVVRFRNRGRQTHEINLVELAPGTTADDAVAWYRKPSGRPPLRSLGGVAVRPGDEGNAVLELKAGARYAFVCAIPDMRGDFAPHVTKGMFTKPFTVGTDHA